MLILYNMDVYEKVKKFYESANAEKRIIGKSLFGRNLYAVKLGCGAPVGIVQYAIHGREFITAELAFIHFKRGLFQGSAWLLPLVNPDGALLSERGLDSVKNVETKKRLLHWNGGTDFSLWKANGRGVDLNVNFPARWGEGAKNVRVAGSENFIGEQPFSEPETLALKSFTEEIRPDYTVSYHTKGEEIYWYFHQPDPKRDLFLAEILSRSTGYKIAYAAGSVGGYKDWCIEKFSIPSFTIEAGREKFTHPLQGEALNDVVRCNRNALYDLTKGFL